MKVIVVFIVAVSIVAALAGCATGSNSNCDYHALTHVRCEDESIEFDSGKLYVKGPVCSKVELRLLGCVRDAAVVEKWIENPSGYQWTGQDTSKCGVEVVKGSCLQFPAHRP
jgi:hypothetical protein